MMKWIIDYGLRKLVVEQPSEDALNAAREVFCRIADLEGRIEVLEARLKATRLALWKAATCVPGRNEE